MPSSVFLITVNSSKGKRIPWQVPVLASEAAVSNSAGNFWGQGNISKTDCWLFYRTHATSIDTVTFEVCIPRQQELDQVQMFPVWLVVLCWLKPETGPKNGDTDKPDWKEMWFKKKVKVQ